MVNLSFKKMSKKGELLRSLLFTDNNDTFDFAANKININREGDDFYQLGDVNIAIRSLDKYEQWSFYTTKGEHSLKKCPLIIKREWVNDGKDVLFNVSLQNPTKQNYEIGGLGFAMIFNQIFTKNSLDESHTNCVFIDPYVGMNAGYIRATRLNGEPPVLLVMPDKQTQFEAYRPLEDDKTQKDVHFEGFYEWTVYSKAYYQTIWNAKKQWNQATSTTIKPGEVSHFQLRFVGIENVHDINKTLAQYDVATIDSYPGYVLHGNEIATLYVNSDHEIKNIRTYPENILTFAPKKERGVFQVRRTKKYYGSVRVTINYDDGSLQTVSYYLAQDAKESVQKLADFHMKNQWLEAPDKYGRQHSFISYDDDNNEKILTEERSYISGDSDEAGAGPNLLMAVKNEMMPNKEQVHRLEKYVDDVLWGNLQNYDYSIKASLYYNNDSSIYSWNKVRGEETWRAYNYPHQAAIYWSLYRLARNYDGLVNSHPWNWYLKQAYKTVMAMKQFCGESAFLQLEQYGLMVGSVHLLILESLKQEEWEEEQQKFEQYMYYRYKFWKNLKYPYGSEMPWDSTGQEEVYIWCDYFGDTDKSKQTLKSILAYTPSIPHWGYDGASRRYFDSFVYGKLFQISREFNHYGSSLNAIPILDQVKKNNLADLRELKVGYAASVSPLTSININGFGSMAFLSDPKIMRFEPYTSDFGQAFYGYTHDAGQYVFNDVDKGWLSFGGNLQEFNNTLMLQPTDAFRKRIFIHNQQDNLFVISETTPFKTVEYNEIDKKIKIKFDKAYETPLKNRIKVSNNLKPFDKAKLVRGSYEYSVTTQTITFVID